MFKIYKQTSILILFFSFALQAEESVKEIAKDTLYASFTEALAHDIGYYHLLNNLRTRVAAYIRRLDFAIRNYIQDLRFQNKQLRADAEAYDLPEMLSNLERVFDAYFRSLDSAFIIISREMDENDDTDDEKLRFLQREMDRMTTGVNKLIRESEVRFAQALS